MLKKIGLVFLGVVVFAFSVFVGYHGFADSKPKEKPNVQVDAKILSTEAYDKIIFLHERMNEQTGWGAISVFTDQNASSWEKLKGMSDDLFARTDKLITQTDNQIIKQDLTNFKKALQLAIEQQDRNLLKIAHRIIHDLDYHVVNPKRGQGGDYWGYTITLEGDNAKGVKEIEKAWAERSS